MRTKELEEIALKAYERLGSVHAVIRRLGYPSKSTLYRWYERRNAGLENRHGHTAEIPEKSAHKCNRADHPRHPSAELLVGWTIGSRPNADLINTMDGVIAELPDGCYPTVHSDRGCHYRWPGRIERMREAGLTRSMSKKGCSPDNASCEGFFGRLKNEMFYGRSWIGVSPDDFAQELDDNINWYNCKRIKMSLGGLSPIEYRQRLGCAV